LIGKLTIKYNRTRQAKITTELIEIISGIRPRPRAASRVLRSVTVAMGFLGR
jgi:RsiW-degrading membrane proteinase PrsW (M82 family)